jgi:NAD(P)-dependent dehydrogenase (short-subunit alcohol dehydrogenase family)
MNRKKRVIITGSSRGIGLATTRKLLRLQNIEIIGTSTSGSHDIESERFKCLQLNLGNHHSISNILERIGKAPIDYLINNAGILLEKWDNPNIDFDQLEKTFNVNLFGTIRLTESLLPQINIHGHIINISSDWGSFSEHGFDEFQPHYKMSKAALNMYTKLLAKRLENKKIKVSSFDPGWVKTDMGGNTASRTPDDVASELVELLYKNVESGKFWHRGKEREW